MKGIWLGFGFASTSEVLVFLYLIIYFSVLVVKDVFEKGTFPVTVLSFPENKCFKSTNVIPAAGQASL